MHIAKRIALVLVIIGAINWGLIGFFQFDLVAAIFGGQQSALSRIIYGLVGLSGLYALTLLFDPIRENNQVSSLNYETEFGDEHDLSNRNDLDNKD